MADRETATATLDAALDALVAMVDASPKDGWDLEAFATGAGTPEGLYRRVRDEVIYEPYRGGLRGARGALEGRAGNAIDQALLLAEALAAQGVAEERIVIRRGRLQQSQAERLVGQTFASATPLRLPSGPPADSEPLLARLAEAFGLEESADRELLAAAVREQGEIGERVLRELMGLAKLDAALLDALTGGEPTGGEWDAAIADAREHAWVAWTDAEGRTIDLDPAFTDGEAGDAVAEVTGELPYRSRRELLTPASVRLFVERLEGGALIEEALWEAELPVAELARSPLRVGIVPSGIDAEGARDSTVAPAVLRDQVLGSEGFQAAVHLGGEARPAQAFDLAGRIRPVTHGALGAGGAITVGLFGVLNALSPAELASVGLRVAVGERRWTARLLDRVAPETRTAGPRIAAGWAGEAGRRKAAARLMQECELSITTWVRSRDRMGIEGTRQVAEAREALRFAVRAAHAEAEGEQPPAGLTPQAGRALSWTLLTEGAAAAQPWVGGEVRAFYASPRIALFVDRPILDGEVRRRERALDVLASGLRVIPNPEVHNSPAMARRYLQEQSAAETLLEAWVAGGPRADNAHNALVRSVAEGVPLRVLRPGDEPDLSAYSEAAQARIREDLVGGFHVVVPERPLELGGRPGTTWFRVDAAGGRLQGRGESGRGNAEWLSVTNILMGLLTGSIIGLAVCRLMHDDPRQAQLCGLRTLIAELALALALLLLGPILGAAALPMIFGVGLWMTVAGLATDHELLTEVGMGFVFMPAGTVLFDDVLPVVFGPAMRRFLQRLRELRTALRRFMNAADEPALALAMSGRGPLRTLMNGLEELDGDNLIVIPSLDDASPLHPRKLTGTQFENLLRHVLRGHESEVLYRPRNTPGNFLPPMRAVPGRFNASGHGVDLFGLDAQGRLWVIEAKWTERVFGVARLGGSARYADGGVQMSPAWRRAAADHFLTSADALPRLRELYDDAGASLADLQARFRRDFESHEAAVIISGMDLQVPTPPSGNRDHAFDLDLEERVYDVIVKP